MKNTTKLIGCFLAGSLLITNIWANQEDKPEEASEIGEDAPWYHIKYECFASDAKGLEILQVVKDSDDEYVSVEIHLRFNDLHEEYFRNIEIFRYYGEDGEQEYKREPWIALVNAGSQNGTTWTSPVIRIPRTWSFDGGAEPYSAVWDDKRQRYRISKWEDEEPFHGGLESELFAVRIECSRYEPDPAVWPTIIQMAR